MINPSGIKSSNLSSYMKGRFKTEDQLLATGWVMNSYGYYEHPGEIIVVMTMIKELAGKIVDTNDVTGWALSPGMLLRESHIVDEMLKLYGE